MISKANDVKFHQNSIPDIFLPRPWTTWPGEALCPSEACGA